MTSPDTTISTRRFSVPGGRLVVRDWGGLAKPLRRNAGVSQSFLDQVFAHSVRTLFREFLVRFIAPTLSCDFNSEL